MATFMNRMTSGGVTASGRVKTSEWVTTSRRVMTSSWHTVMALPYLRPLSEAGDLLTEPGLRTSVLGLKVGLMVRIACQTMQWRWGNYSVNVTWEGRWVAGEWRGRPTAFHWQGFQEDLIITAAVGKLSKGWTRGHHWLTVPPLLEYRWGMATPTAPVGPAPPPDLGRDRGRAHQFPACSTL